MHVSRVSQSCRIGQRHSSHISSVSLTDPPRRIFDALSATGFLYLRDAVPETAPILRASRRFFQLPADVKETARSNVSRSPKGYHRRFRQGDEMEALTEAFTFGLEVQSPAGAGALSSRLFEFEQPALAALLQADEPHRLREPCALTTFLFSPFRTAVACCS